LLEFLQAFFYLKQAEDHQERKQLKSSPHAKSKTTCAAAAAAAAQHKTPHS